MLSMPQTYNPYSDIRRAELTFTFGIIAPEAEKTAIPTSSAQSPQSQIEQTHDGVETLTGKYTTLERNMFLLSGELELYGENVKGVQTGWISSALSDDTGVYTENTWVEFSFSTNQDSYGFTLIFDDKQPENYPAEITATAYGADGAQIATVTERPTNFKYVVGLAAKGYRRVRFTFGKSRIPNRRARLTNITFGVIYEYGADNLTGVTIRRSISPYSLNLPSTEVTATVDNQNQLYNMINPTGLYQFLQDGQYMDYQIKINGESVKMGRQYFTDAKSKDGGLTAEITFNDWLYVLDNVDFDGGASGTWTLSQAVTVLLATVPKLKASAVYEDGLDSVVIRKCIPKQTKVREALRLCAQAAMCTCYIDRDDNLRFVRPKIKAVSDVWTRDTQHSDAQIKVGQLFNTVGVRRSDVFSANTEDELFVARNIAPEDIQRIYEVENPLVNDGQAVAQWILEWIQRRVSYDVTVRGNPALDLLDTVQIDDYYGVNGSAVLTKLDFRYDGGLSCDAEGVR